MLTSDVLAIDRVAHLKNIAKIEVKKQVYLEVEENSANSVRLKDVAVFYGLNQEIRAELESIVVAELTAEQSELSLTSLELSEKFREPLLQIQKKKNIRIMFKVPPQVSLIKRQKFEEAAVKKRIIERMRRSCEACEFDVSNLRLPELSQEIKNSNWVIHFESHPRGSFSLPVVFKTEAGKNKTQWISGRAIKKQLVPVATRRLGIGQRVGESDFKMSYRDVTYAVDGVPQEKNLVGKKLRSGVMFDHIIWSNHIERRKALRYGDKAQVIAGQEGWEIQVTAIAQENADVGDTVRLLNPKTRKYISGVVVGDKLVRLQ